jgi:RNA-directed DNA polymerase
MPHDVKGDPSEVPAGAVLAGEAEPLGWAERAVWTERMKECLRNGGPEGGKWYRLHDKVFAEKTLRAAFARVAANGGAAGVDGKEVEQFGDNLDEEIARLRAAWQAETYRPQAVRRTWIPKPGTNEQRPLGIPTVRDRTVQAALKLVLEPIFESTFSERSYGFRPGRRAQEALAAVLSSLHAGTVWVVDADLKGYFDSIPHERLLEAVRRKVTDRRVLALIGMFLKAGIMDGDVMQPSAAGTPQGGVISPLLANIYLNDLDHLMEQGTATMIRYADDFVILCHTRQEAERVLGEVSAWTAHAGLTLHPTKTRLVNMAEEREYIDFLGFRIRRIRTKNGKYRYLREVRPKSMTAIKQKIRHLTPRLMRDSWKVSIVRLNAVLRGWFGYFRSANADDHTMLDQMVRRRLRSMLCRVHGITRWSGKLSVSRQWPNAFFAQHGLLSLERAHAEYTRALQRAR